MLEEGMIIKGPFWKEPVKIQKSEEFAGWIRIIGATIYSNEHIDQLIPKEDIEKLETSEFVLDFTSKASEAFLAIEGLRFRFASLFDPLLAMNTSKIDPLPFQIEAVYGYILKLPKIRFLIADDPGAGKTIMAGLVIKELKLRGIIRRILIVVPGHLKDQWRRELKEKFEEHFTVIDRGLLDAHYGENPWQRENQIITSIDFAKREEILPSLSSVHWDLVIVDEAHKMAAYRYGDKLSRTKRYKLGETLSKTTDHLIFLTATPHKGDPENFRLFLDLLVPGFFATPELIDESLKNRDNPLFIRRIKEDLKDFEGKPLFTHRYPRTIKFRLSEKEKKLYNELSRYVISQYNKALQMDKKRNVAFALLILQRRMASSTYALLKSLERRKERLEELLKGTKPIKETPTYIDVEDVEDYDEVDDYDEEARRKQEEKWETLSVAENREELQKEIATLSDLIASAKEILDEEHEIKIIELKKAIEEGFKKIREMEGNEKILIFTESKDTMEYLVKKISSWGYSVTWIHGGMSLEERITAERVFKNEKQIMVATEAAGEGINLQFCHLMINYDIPWNPNRLEQRMGRIHRYGQQKNVYVFNLVAEDTREGQVLSKMFEKLEEIRDAIGSDRVFDVIGDVFYGKNLYQLILDAVANSRIPEEITKELDIKIDEKYIKNIRDALGESLATKHIDYTRIKEMAEKAKEYKLIPEYVEEFFKKAFEKAGGKFRIRKDGFIAIDAVPSEIRKIGDAVDFKNRYGIILKEYQKATFDKEIAFKNTDAEFISFGHPLFEAIIEWVNINYFTKLQKGAVFEDPSGRYNGILWFFEGEVKDGKGNIAGKKIMAIYDNGKELKEVKPAILWDFVPQDANEPAKLDISKEKAQEYAINAVEAYKQEIFEERKRQAEIKRKYGIKSLEYLICELDGELAELYERTAKGEKVDIVIQNKEERKEKYQKSLETLKKEIEQEKSLTISMPKFLGAILVKPTTSREMISDEEVERRGMEIAMEYEKTHGREPEDVSKENIGFDIRSKGNGETRYIEVKARKDEGEVVLTPNEWFKAKRFKEQYWLYVVSNAVSNPVLTIINNPAENLNVHEKVEVVRFVVPLEEWKNKGVKA
ncbi:helicase-related protein [Caldisericum sp.]|uniref:helicase-related protein n=1 Tax=Caldisericum sp. TaxID=2499687 RepID=UPI003D14F45F